MGAINCCENTKEDIDSDDDYDPSHISEINTEIWGSKRKKLISKKHLKANPNDSMFAQDSKQESEYDRAMDLQMYPLTIQEEESKQQAESGNCMDSKVITDNYEL